MFHELVFWPLRQEYNDTADANEENFFYSGISLKRNIPAECRK